MIKPEDIIANYSIEELNETAEAYFRDMPDTSHVMAKPFSDISEAGIVLPSFGALLVGLKLAKTMTVLEFAAGSCWMSRYLNQLQCQTISSDVSQSALEVGKRLFETHPIIGEPIAEPRFLHLDGHTINLPDQSVDRIICLGGFHHVPNQEAILGEMARVLKPGGIAGFAEPGPYHSKSGQSQSEMRNFKVLENDIILPDIFQRAKRQGFTDLKVLLLEDIEVSLPVYRLLTNPLSIRLIRLFHPRLAARLIQKTVFFLYKGKPVLDSRGHHGLNGSIRPGATHLTVPSGETLALPLTIQNSGKALWLTENVKDIGVVQIGTHLYSAEDDLIDFEFSRHAFDQPLLPEASLEKTIQLRFDQPGRYRLVIDLVAEQVCWFENIGVSPVSITVDVT